MRFPWLFAAAALPAVLVAGLVLAPAGAAQEGGGDPPVYTELGADQCLKCHDELSDFPIRDIFNTKHGSFADSRTPMAKFQCETCHGPGSEHGDMGITEDDPRPPIRSFNGRGDDTPVPEQNAVCLSCHDNRHRTEWRGSVHQSNELACADCHQVHTLHDPALEPREQPRICFRCHTRQRAESFRASTHPVRHGLMTCASCHAPHGSLTEGMLKETSLNRTCYQCHAEKRGPFLWEHAPATEDCSLCHRPHGSNHTPLLKQRAPLLCQQCHSQLGHPSIAYTGELDAGTLSSGLLFQRSCLNCHSQVHGSNHPSGVNLKR